MVKAVKILADFGFLFIYSLNKAQKNVENKGFSCEKVARVVTKSAKNRLFLKNQPYYLGLKHVKKVFLLMVYNTLRSKALFLFNFVLSLV